MVEVVGPNFPPLFFSSFQLVKKKEEKVFYFPQQNFYVGYSYGRAG